MSTGWVWHERYAWHDARGLIDTMPREALFEPEPSLESATTKRRLRNLVDASGLLGQLTEIPARPATDDELGLLHERDYVRRLRTQSAAGGGDAGGFTPFGRWSYEIAALAAGGCMEAVDAVISGRVRNAYALVRPPGHHAGPAGGSGYCLFSNVALSVLRLRHEHGLERVAVVDWDVHHGNGTQDSFWSDGSALTISIHQEDLYPAGSGLVDEVGEGHGAGANINVPLPAGSGRAAYLATIDSIVVPALERFARAGGLDFILVANGLDASLNDPLGRMNLTSECFALMTERLMSAAEKLCDGRLVLCHEGGYSSTYVPYCGLAILQQLSGITTEVVDPWISDTRQVRWLPLREHEDRAIERARAMHEL